MNYPASTGRDICVLLAAFVGALGLAGGDILGVGGPTAPVRVLHASLGAGTASIVVDGEPKVNEISFSGDPTQQTVTKYVDVPADGEATIEILSRTGTVTELEGVGQEQGTLR